MVETVVVAALALSEFKSHHEGVSVDVIAKLLEDLASGGEARLRATKEPSVTILIKVARETEHVEAVDVVGNSQSTAHITSGGCQKEHGVVVVTNIKKSEFRSVSLNYGRKLAAFGVVGKTVATVGWLHGAERMSARNLEEPVKSTIFFDTEDDTFVFDL